jgi:ribonuclease HI
MVSNLQEPNAKAWLAAVFEDLPHGELTRVVVTLWALWHVRRKVIHEGVYQSPLSIHHFMERFIAELQVITLTKTAARSMESTGLRWLPPPEGMVKINVDAATSKNSSKVAFAAVVQQADGLFLGASSVVMEGVTDPETLEALACREGLPLAADLLVQNFRVASDSRNAVRSIRGDGMGSYGHIVHEIKARAATFQRVDFVFEKRMSNLDAHCVARSSIYLQLGRHVWFHNPPDGVPVNIRFD